MKSRFPDLRPGMGIVLVAFLALFLVLLASVLTLQKDEAAFFSVSNKTLNVATQGGPASKKQPTPRFRTSVGPILTPTPDAPHKLPPVRTDAEQYTVQAGDSLAGIARKYGVSLDQLVQSNKVSNPDIISVGQLLEIPVPTPDRPGPGFKVIPDSELVYGPATAGFDLAGFIQSQAGYLAHYQETINDRLYTSAQIVDEVARDFSVNPRLLLAVLEYQSGWVTKADPPKETLDYPLRYQEALHKGLYRQLSWAANNLNRGFYIYRVNGTPTWLLADGSIVPIAPTINPGTAGVQQFFAWLYDYPRWLQAVGPQGVFATYNAFFGYPFQYAVEPLLPVDLQQPRLQLPFETGVKWSFTGGPHAGWGDGSAWAALDFAPPSDLLGCVQNNAWVVASADGLILRALDGAVVEDLDGDGNEGSGWTILYMHIESRQRAQPGTYVKAGDHIGHPSCEGGVSTGTHTHLARRYNGEWIPADQSIPFNLDGWISYGAGGEYDGTLQRNGQSIEAFAGNSTINIIQR